MGVLYDGLSPEYKAQLDGYVNTLKSVRPYDFYDHLTAIMYNQYAVYVPAEISKIIEHLSEFDTSLINPFNNLYPILSNRNILGADNRLIEYVNEFRNDILDIERPPIKTWNLYKAFISRIAYIDNADYGTSLKFDSSGNPIKKYFVDDVTSFQHLRTLNQFDMYDLFPVDDPLYSEDIIYFIENIKKVIEFSSNTPSGRRCELITMSELEENLINRSKFINFRDNLYWKKPLNYDYLKQYLEAQIRNDNNREPLYGYLFSLPFDIVRYIHDHFKNYNYDTIDFRVIPSHLLNVDYSVGDRLYTTFFPEAVDHYQNVSGNNINLKDIFKLNKTKSNTLLEFKNKFIEEYPDKEDWLNPLMITKETLQNNRTGGDGYPYYNFIPNFLKTEISNNVYKKTALSNIDIIFYEMYHYDYYFNKYVIYFHTNYFKNRYILDDLYFTTLKDYILISDLQTEEHKNFKQYILNIDIDEFKYLFTEARTYHLNEINNNLSLYNLETFRYEIMGNSEIFKYVKRVRYLNNEDYFTNLLNETELNDDLREKISDFYGLYRYFVLEMIELYQKTLTFNLDPINVTNKNYYLVVNTTGYLGSVYNKFPVIDELPEDLNSIEGRVFYLAPSNEIVTIDNGVVVYYTVENKSVITVRNNYAYSSEYYKSFLFKDVIKQVKFNLPPLDKVYGKAKIYTLKSNTTPKNRIENININNLILVKSDIALKSVTSNVNFIYNYTLS